MPEFFQDLFKRKQVQVEDSEDHEEKPQQLPVVEEPSPSERLRSPLETPEEGVLESREKTDSKLLGGGCNTTVFIELKDDGSGIFKPKSGENENLRENIRAGTYFQRERAAYLLDKFLGFDLVPPTVVREIDGEIGSFQQFIPDAQPGRRVEHSELDEAAIKQQLIKLWIFDCIIFNSDRHWSNFLVKDKKVYAIDNGLSFGDEIFYPHDSFFDVPIPPEIVEGIKKFLLWKEGRKICEDLLGELLSSEEVAACMRRIERIASIIKQHGQVPRESELVF
ncbi:MAG: hypothetical protein WAP55_01440 [Minisyncoccia bacterium]